MSSYNVATTWYADMLPFPDKSHSENMFRTPVRAGRFHNGRKKNSLLFDQVYMVLVATVTITKINSSKSC